VNVNSARQKMLFASACAGILAFGIVLAVLGTVFGMPGMRTRLHIDLAQQGDLFFLLYVGILLASLVVGPVTDHSGHKLVLFVSSLLVSIGMISFSAAHSMTTAGAAAILLGLGGGGLNTCTSALVSDLYGDRRGPMLNVLGIFFGIGALCIPLLAASLEGHFTIVQLLILCSVLSGLCALAYAVLGFPAPTPVHAFSWRETLRVARYSGIWLIGLLLFFESGSEASVSGWTSTYANTSGFSSSIAIFVLACYWSALMFGRILAASLLRVMKKAYLVLASALLSLIGCGILLSAQSLPWLSIGVALIGFSHGPIFPTALAIAGDRYSAVAGTVFGLLFSIALVGGMTFPWAVGQISQQFSVRSGMIVPLLGAFGICCASAILVRQSHSASVSKAGGRT
jgi:MFS transporter, FHS family, glucose/mannose:H+ symporter